MGHKHCAQRHHVEIMDKMLCEWIYKHSGVVGRSFHLEERLIIVESQTQEWLDKLHVISLSNTLQKKLYRNLTMIGDLKILGMYFKFYFKYLIQKTHVINI